MNVLVLAPHPDDEAIGCGGTLCDHAGRGDHVSAVFLTSGELGLKHLPRAKAWARREREARQAARILGITTIHFLRLPDWTLGDHVSEAARRLRPILRREKPARIYLPHPREWHPDHQAALPVLRAALRGRGLAWPELCGYEVWTALPEPHHVQDISRCMARKLRAVRAHRSQLKEFDYARAIAGLNRFRGELKGRCKFAEAFEVIHPKPEQ